MNLQAAVLLLALVTTAEGAPSLRFVSVGDWGIGSVAEEKNPGERAASEAVADAMAADVAAEGAAFVLALGDNFYQDGVANATDGLWERAWRGLWLAKRGGALAGRPWYAILGNHDYHQGLDAALSQTRRMTDRRKRRQRGLLPPPLRWWPLEPPALRLPREHQGLY